MKKRKIIAVTSSRADFSIQKELVKELKKKANLKLIVTGTHFSRKHGMTWKEIKKQNIKIDYKIEVIRNKKKIINQTEIASKILLKSAEILNDFKPDIILILGDRFEMHAIASSALILRIPIVHIHGGELTSGAFDDALRHSITKMSHVHIVAHDTYKKRIIQMGENPNSVFSVGSLSIDNIKKIKFLSKIELENKLNIKFKNKNLIVTFHPTTLKKDSGLVEISNLFNTLKKLRDTLVIFTTNNIDPEADIIMKEIAKEVKISKNFYLFPSLGQKIYFSILNIFDGVIGNSSSGIIEAPSFNIGIINIGNRQSGRFRAGQIIDCDVDSKSISVAIKKMYSKKYLNLLKNSSNPFKKNNTLKKIVKIILNYPLDKILEKKFYNIK